MNLPLNQLACTGIGQAEPLTALVRRLQRGIEAGRLTEVAQFLDCLEAGILADRTGASRIRRATERYVVRRIKQWLLAWLASHPHARYSRLFLSEPSVRDRFRRYYRHTLTELSQLATHHGIRVPAPSHVIFGHTHQPIPWGTDELVDDIDGHAVRFCNTGGWLLNPAADGEFVGAEVVVYESGRGFRSHSVRRDDLVPQPAMAGVS